MSKTLAIVTSQGGPTSHTAILARARGIVAVVSAAEAENLTDGTTVVVNAAKGELVVDPTEEEIAAAEAAKSRAAAAKELRGNPGSTKDGHLIPLLANVGKPADAAKALEYGAEGVGLFRTEFLFIGNSEPPTVEEQTRAYTELLSQFPGKKVVIRMLDAGADKPLRSSLRKTSRIRLSACAVCAPCAPTWTCSKASSRRSPQPMPPPTRTCGSWLRWLPTSMRLTIS